MNEFDWELKQLGLLKPEDSFENLPQEDQEVIIARLRKLEGGEYSEGVDPHYAGGLEPRSASNNFGYAPKDKVLDAIEDFGPGPIGTAAGLINKARNLNNRYAVRKGREVLGIDPKETLGEGQLGDIKIGDKTYPVGYEAIETESEGLLGKKDVAGFIGSTVGGMSGVPFGGAIGGALGKAAVDGEEFQGRTNLTLDEARKRQAIAQAQSKPRGLVARAQQVASVRAQDITQEAKAPGRGLMGISPTFEKSISNEYSLGNEQYDPNSDLETRTRALNVDYSLGPKRSEKPASGIEFRVADVVRDVLGSGYSVDVISGQEPQGRKPAGSPFRHPLGLAADLKIKGPDGRTLSVDNPEDAQAIKDVAQGMAARYNANFGMGRAYMGPETMHIDTVDLDGPIAEAARKAGVSLGAQWGALGKSLAGTLDMARAEGVMPSRYYDVDAPAPQARPNPGEDMVAEGPTNSGFGFMSDITRTQLAAPASQTVIDRPTATASVDLSRGLGYDTKARGLMAATLAGEIDPNKTDLTTEEGRREAFGILSTIENRKGKFGGDIAETIRDPKQYSTWNNPSAAATAQNNYKANRAVYDGLVNDFIGDPKSNLGYTHYHANYVSPGWSAEMQNTTDIGPHRFGILGEYKGAFGTNFSGTPETQDKVSKPTTAGAGTGVSASAKASFGSRTSGFTSGIDTSRGMMSDENANRSTSSMSSRNNEDRNSPSSSTSKSSFGSSEGKGSYGSSGRSGYSSIGSSSGFSSQSTGSSKTSSSGKGSYGSSGRSGYSSIGSSKSSGFGSKSSSTPKSSNHGYSGSRSDGWG